MTKKLGSTEKAKKYCGALFWKTHGKEEGAKLLKKELLELKKALLND